MTRNTMPGWGADPGSAAVLMEYLRRASSQFVAAELDKLDLLDAADELAAAKYAAIAPRRPSRASLWMVALAMCAVVAVAVETRHVGALSVDDTSQFMRLAGPTAEW